MDDDRLDGLLRTLSDEAMGADAGSEFRDKVWQRIGQMSEARERRRKTILGLAIFAVALGAGMGTTQSPAHAERPGFGLTDGASLSPSALLRVTP